MIKLGRKIDKAARMAECDDVMLYSPEFLSYRMTGVVGCLMILSLYVYC